MILSSNAVVSQIMQGAVAQIISIENSGAVYIKTIIALNNKVVLSDECRSVYTDEHLKKPTVKSVPKSKVLSLVDQYIDEIVIADDDVRNDYVDLVVEIKQGEYEY